MQQFLHFHNIEYDLLNITAFHINSALNLRCHIALLVGGKWECLEPEALISSPYLYGFCNCRKSVLAYKRMVCMRIWGVELDPLLAFACRWVAPSCRPLENLAAMQEKDRSFFFMKFSSSIDQVISLFKISVQHWNTKEFLAQNSAWFCRHSKVLLLKHVVKDIDNEECGSWSIFSLHIILCRYFIHVNANIYLHLSMHTCKLRSM